MILIRKPNAPARLEAGIARTQQDCIEFDKNRKHYLDGNSFVLNNKFMVTRMSKTA